MAETLHRDNDISTRDIAAWCVHGGRLREAAAAFPDAPRPWIDLSTGINPHAWDTARAGEIDWRALPDDGALAELEAAAAAHFGVAADHVCAVPGSELALRLLSTLDLPAPVRHVAPGYGTHAIVGKDGAIAIAIATEALALEAGQGGTILLANPNNPDGRMWRADGLADIAVRLAERGGLLIVDQAFGDLDDTAGLPLDHVVALRSFGKFFGLAGLRLGFVCAAPERLAALRMRLGSWPVSAAAIAIGTAACCDTGWIAATRTKLREEAARLDALLDTYGLKARGDCALFRLVETPEAHRLFTRLARHGILTRPFGYASQWLRFGLPGDAASWARLERALADG